jgi:hypothetical protein
MSIKVGEFAKTNRGVGRIIRVLTDDGQIVSEGAVKNPTMVELYYFGDRSPEPDLEGNAKPGIGVAHIGELYTVTSLHLFPQ